MNSVFAPAFSKVWSIAILFLSAATQREVFPVYKGHQTPSTGDIQITKATHAIIEWQIVPTALGIVPKSLLVQITCRNSTLRQIHVGIPIISPHHRCLPDLRYLSPAAWPCHRYHHKPRTSAKFFHPEYAICKLKILSWNFMHHISIPCSGLFPLPYTCSFKFCK